MSSSRFRRIAQRPWRRLVVALGTSLERSREAIARASLPRFATDAPGLVIRLPYEIRNPERIRFGHDVRIGANSMLLLLDAYPGNWMRHPDGAHVAQTFEPELVIGDRVTATGALQIAVYQRVTIEDDVLLAGNVYISDGMHASRRGDTPYKFQGIERIAPVRVGRGAWLGQNVVVLPGVTIGAHAIVGANAVVAGDVPDGCVAVGAPARVVRRWDPSGERWLDETGGAAATGSARRERDPA
jgi:acetyltransferase-like isoleucine patch superfamily enzyme